MLRVEGCWDSGSKLERRRRKAQADRETAWQLVADLVAARSKWDPELAAAWERFVNSVAQANAAQAGVERAECRALRESVRDLLAVTGELADLVRALEADHPQTHRRHLEAMERARRLLDRKRDLLGARVESES